MALRVISRRTRVDRAERTESADEDSVEALTAKVAALRRTQSEGTAEDARLREAAESAATYAEATELSGNAWEARKRARDASVELAELEPRLVAAQTAAKFVRTREHAARLEDSVRTLITALEAAARANTASLAAYEAARRELGDSLALRYVCPAPTVFNGLVREDLVGSWGRDILQQLAAARRAVAAALRPAAAPPPVAAAPQPIPIPPPIAAAARPPDSLQRPVAAIGGHDVTAEVLTARRAADDLTELAPGQVRVVSLSDGWSPAADRPQTHRGQKIRMPIAEAHEAARRGLVRIIDQADSRAAQE
jgi:hypothetical protein